MLGNLSFTKIIDSPLPWATAGFVIGLVFGVSTLSVWLVAIGLGGYLVYLALHGPAERATEGWLFAAGPAYMMAWVLGFIVKGFLL